MDPHTPFPVGHTVRSNDADRVEVRALAGAIMSRYRLIAGLMIGMGLLFWLVAGQMNPVYSANSKVLLDQQNVQVSRSDAVVSTTDMSEPVIFSEMSVMRSNVLLGSLISSLGIDRLETDFFDAPRPEFSEDARIAALVDAIRDNLVVQREAQSYVVSIRFEGHDPALAAEVANGIADTYIDVQLSSRRESVRQATAWIEDLVAEAGAQVEAAETALSTARALSLDREGGSYENANQQLANMTSALAVARSELAAANAEYDRLVSIFNEGGPQALAKAVTSPMLERLMVDRVDLQRNDEEWARSFDTNHPQRVRLAKEIANVDAEIASEAERVIALRNNSVAVAEMRAGSLEDSVKSLEDQLAGISENTVDLRQREREAEAARRNYETLLARLSSATGQDKLQMPEARVIERAAVPEAPSSPRPKLLAAFGGTLGLTIGLVAALSLEMTRSTFRNRSEIEAETGQRVLASLPQVVRKSTREVVYGLRGNQGSLYGERIRQLRTLLFMSTGEFEKRVIMVTSSRPGEGKSLTTMALAKMVALSGKSVIVVDADLRRSTLAKVFEWTPEFDMVDVAVDCCDFEDAIYTDAKLGFDVLPTVRHSTEAADDLSTDWLRPMVADLRKMYDVVLIDSPPLLDVADGLVLARVADSIVYVVRWDTTPRQVVCEGLASLSAMRLGVAGIVLNHVDPKYAERAYGNGYATY